MLPDRVLNPGPLTYESGALPIALRGPATLIISALAEMQLKLEIFFFDKNKCPHPHQIFFIFFFKRYTSMFGHNQSIPSEKTRPVPIQDNFPDSALPIA